MDKVARAHSSAEKEQHMKDSTHSRTASSKERSAEAWAVCGTTRAEYTNLPKEAQWRRSSRAT